MGNSSVIDSGAKKEIDNVVDQIKKASRKHGFYFWRFDGYNQRALSVDLEGRYHLKLNGAVRIEEWLWQHQCSFKETLVGSFKPLSLSGYYVDKSGDVYKIDKVTDKDIGTIKFKKEDRYRGFFGELEFKDFCFNINWYQCILPKERLLLYMVGEAPYLTTGQEETKYTNARNNAMRPILHLVISLTCESVWSRKEAVAHGLGTLFNRLNNLDALCAKFSEVSWVAGTIVYEHVRRVPMLLEQTHGINPFGKFRECLEKELDKTDAIHLQRILQKSVENPQYRFSDTIYRDYHKGTLERKGSKLTVNIEDMRMNKPDMPKSSFNVLAVRGYLKVKENDSEKVYLLKSSDDTKGSLHVRTEIESNALWDKKETAEVFRKELESRRGKTDEENEGDRYCTFRLEDLKEEEGKKPNIPNTGLRDGHNGQLGLLLFGAGVLNGKAVTVVAMKLDYITQQSDTYFLVGEHQNSYADSKVPNVATFSDGFYNLSQYYKELGTLYGWKLDT